jgi:curli biogenesis system outer membrane secretion channel CsgG
MRRSIFFYSILVGAVVILVTDISLAQIIKPKARGTPTSGPTIDEAQKEDYMGPKAGVAVTRFEDKSAKGSGEIGEGMAEMLSNALFSTNRYIVLERQALDDVLSEQDLGASGRVRHETAPSIGEIEGADLLILGTITEFEPGASGVGGESESPIPLPERVTKRLGDVFGGIKASGGFTKSHVALIVKVVDAKTGRRLASEQVEGKATDIEGMAGLGGGVLSGVFSGYSKTPMEKAIRIAINEAVKLIVAKTPKKYYRVPPPSETQTTPTTMVPQQTLTTPSTPPQPSAPPSQDESCIVYVKWPKVSLREGPGTNYKSLLQVQKGTALEILEESNQWYRVRLEDGQEGWIGKATTSENP